MIRFVIALIIGLAFATFATQSLGQTSISTGGVIESKSGGFKFPDGSVQNTASKLGGKFCDYPYVVTGFTEEGNCFCSNGKECRQPGACPTLESESLCSNATVYPDISGDSGSDFASMSGHGDAWIKFNVLESSSLINEPIIFQASLSVPAGTDYDLEVLCGACGDIDNRLVSNNPGAATEVLTVGWADILGSDESREIMIHVSFFGSPGCLEDDWTLEIMGNTGSSARNCPVQ